MLTLEYVLLMAIDDGDYPDEEKIHSALMDYIDISDCLNELKEHRLVELYTTEESDGTVTITSCSLTPHGEERLKYLS